MLWLPEVRCSGALFRSFRQRMMQLLQEVLPSSVLSTHLPSAVQQLHPFVHVIKSQCQLRGLASYKHDIPTYYRCTPAASVSSVLWAATGMRGATACRGHAQVKARGEPEEDDVSVAAHLLRLHDPDTGRPLPDGVLAGEFGLFFSAGIESAGNAISWTL
jgi:hypothetical protein